MKKYKAQVVVTLRENILDVQGKAIEHALHSLDFDMMSDVRIGKHIELEIEAQNDGQAEAFLEEAGKKLLSNPVIEDFTVKVFE